MSVQAVVFDIGNVLMRWEPEAFYDARLGPEKRRVLFDTCALPEMNRALDLGAPFRETVGDWAARYPHWAPEIMHWHDSWSDFVTGPIDGSVAVMHGLRGAGMPVFALSNFGLGPLAIAEERLPWLADFDRRFISGALGVVKPDPAIYAVVEAECGLPPDALFFIDDKAENVAAAATRGWQGHVFTAPDAMARALRQAGVAW